MDFIKTTEQDSNYDSLEKMTVNELLTNINNEVTGATVLKGGTREIVKRHSSVLIPLLKANLVIDNILF